MNIRIGIVGYGNLARGVEASVQLQPDMELIGVFSRRQGIETVSGVPTYTMEDIPNFKGKIDVMVLCGGSATDLIEQTPMVTKYFNCIDSFDTHARIPEHFANVDKVAKEAKTATLISCGWDPGMFSLQRVYAEAILPKGKSYTFWGRGVSQGHSDAIRRIDGVLDARQYTVPKEQYLEAIRNGETPDVDGYKGHLRECYVVAAPDADKAKIENEIKTMENYFVGYETVVNFISQEELDRDHKGIPHGKAVGYFLPGYLDSMPESLEPQVIMALRAAGFGSLEQFEGFIKEMLGTILVTDQEAKEMVEEIANNDRKKKAVPFEITKEQIDKIVQQAR